MQLASGQDYHSYRLLLRRQRQIFFAFVASTRTREHKEIRRTDVVLQLQQTKGNVNTAKLHPTRGKKFKTRHANVER